MSKNLFEILSYAAMAVIVVIVILMWTGNFPMQYSYIAIIFASVILILRIVGRFYFLSKKKRG
jgi:hypothetical protein